MYFGWFKTGFTIRANDKIASRLTSAASPNAKRSHSVGASPGLYHDRLRLTNTPVLCGMQYSQKLASFEKKTWIIRLPLLYWNSQQPQYVLAFWWLLIQMAKKFSRTIDKFANQEKTACNNHIENQWAICSAWRDAAREIGSFLLWRQTVKIVSEIFLWVGRTGLTKVLFLV